MHNYDVYFMTQPTSTDMITRLTFDGSAVIDGIPNWVYEG